MMKRRVTRNQRSKKRDRCENWQDDLLQPLSQVSPVIFVSFKPFHLLVHVVDPGVHPVGLIQQSVDGVVLALELRLEAQAQVLQSGQATAHLIWVSQRRTMWWSLDFSSNNTIQHHKDALLGCSWMATKLEIVFHVKTYLSIFINDCWESFKPIKNRVHWLT